LHFDDDEIIHDFDYTLNQAERKWDKFEDYAQKYGLAPTQCAIVGNGEGDKLLFERLGYSVLIDSEEKTEELSSMVDIELKSLHEVAKVFVK
jgi:hypothetical protein